MSYEPGREPQAPDTLRLVIDNGYLSFDPESTDDANLGSWLENRDPEDLIHGRVVAEIPVRVGGWNEDGPILYIGDELEGGDDE